MKEQIWRISQLLLAGGFVIIAATKGDLATKSGPAEPSPLINDLQLVAQAVNDSPGEQKKPTLVGPDRTMELIKGASTIEDLNALPLPQGAKSLIESMVSDEFDIGNPFVTIDIVYAMGLILQRGVQNFHRDAYRSPQFTQDLGYDVLKYEVVNNDGQSSFILAYKDKTGPGQTGIGLRDMRPSFAIILVPQDEGLFHLSFFAPGKPAESHNVAKEDAMKRILSHISPSTPLLTSRTNY